MKSSKRILWLVLLCMPGLYAAAQQSATVLTEEKFIEILLENHPVIKQAGLRTKQAEASVTEARGLFDPVLSTQLDRKTFDGTDYYSYLNPQVSLPTGYGVEFRAGTEQIRGDRVTIEETQGRTSYAGVKITANEVVFDKRRAALQQAKIFTNLTRAEQRATVNDILREGLQTYLNWLKEYRVYRIVTDAVEVNRERVRFTKVEFEQGVRPAIDTVEAIAQMNSVMLQQNNSYLAFRNAAVDLSFFLWDNSGRPAALAEGIVPDTSAGSEMSETGSLPALEELMRLGANHPEIESASQSVALQKTDLRLKAQMLWPQIAVTGNILDKGYRFPGPLKQDYITNNHKFGVQVNVPLFFRSAAGALKSARFKLQEEQMERDLQAKEIENLILRSYNTFTNSRKQLEMFREIALNSKQLYDGEMLRYRNGESTLFLVNSRENKLLEARQKAVEAEVKWKQSYFDVLWSAGKLPEIQ